MVKRHGELRVQTRGTGQCTAAPLRAEGSARSPHRGPGSREQVAIVTAQCGARRKMGLKEDIFLPPGLFPSRSFRGRPPCAGRKEILFRLKRKSPPQLVGRREPAAGTGAAARSAAWEFLVGCYCCFVCRGGARAGQWIDRGGSVGTVPSAAAAPTGASLAQLPGASLARLPGVSLARLPGAMEEGQR